MGRSHKIVKVAEGGEQLRQLLNLGSVEVKADSRSEYGVLEALHQQHQQIAAKIEVQTPKVAHLQGLEQQFDTLLTSPDCASAEQLLVAAESRLPALMPFCRRGAEKAAKAQREAQAAAERAREEAQRRVIGKCKNYGCGKQLTAAMLSAKGSCMMHPVRTRHKATGTGATQDHRDWRHTRPEGLAPHKTVT